MSALTDFLTGIANAIRAKNGTSGTIAASNFATQIAAIETGVDTSDATATAKKILNGETAYVDGVKITGSTLYCMTTCTTTSGDNIKIPVPSKIGTTDGTTVILTTLENMTAGIRTLEFSIGSSGARTIFKLNGTIYETDSAVSATRITENGAPYLQVFCNTFATNVNYTAILCNNGEVN